MTIQLDRQLMQYTLPRLPAKGQRRKLEAQWLGVLEAGGMSVESVMPQGDAPAQLFDAVSLFNNGQYWECHEVLEEVWLETPYPQRFFWSALIKLAVGLHHTKRHNLHGARVKLGDAARLLPMFQSQCLGVDTATALTDALQLLHILDTAPLNWATLDELPKPVIALQAQL